MLTYLFWCHRALIVTKILSVHSKALNESYIDMHYVQKFFHYVHMYIRIDAILLLYDVLEEFNNT